MATTRVFNFWAFFQVMATTIFIWPGGYVLVIVHVAGGYIILILFALDFLAFFVIKHYKSGFTKEYVTKDNLYQRLYCRM
jgi:hypothetical protein